MVMPGDRIKMEVELIQPIAIELWLKFKLYVFKSIIKVQNKMKLQNLSRKIEKIQI